MKICIRMLLLKQQTGYHLDKVNITEPIENAIPIPMELQYELEASEKKQSKWQKNIYYSRRSQNSSRIEQIFEYKQLKDKCVILVTSLISLRSQEFENFC